MVTTKTKGAQNDVCNRVFKTESQRMVLSNAILPG